MIEENKQAFRQMMNLLMETYRQQKPSAEMLRLWWSKLERYEIENVCKSFDTWIDTKTHAPTPADLIDLCRHKVTMVPRIASPLSIENNRQHAADVKEKIQNLGGPKRDMKGWAKKILANPKAYPEISVKYAREALL